MADLDPDNLHRYRVVDLKEILSRRGLSTTGLKADLIKRLRETLLLEIQGAANQQSQEDDLEEEPDFEGQEIHGGEQQEWVHERNRSADIITEDVIRAEATVDVGLVGGEQWDSAVESNLPVSAEKNWHIEQQRIQAQKQWQEDEVEQQEEEKLRILELEQRRQLEGQRLQQLEEQRLQQLEEQRLQQLEEQRLRQIEEQHQLEELHLRQLEEHKMRQLEEERQQQLEEERQRKLEEERQRCLAEERQRLLEEQRQRQIEQERRRQLEELSQRELEEQKQRELEELRQRRLEELRQRDLEELRQRELEELRQRELEKQRQLEEERQCQLEEQRMQKLEEEKQRQFQAAEKQRQIEEAESMRRIEEEKMKFREKEKRRQIEKQLNDESSDNQILWLSEQQEQENQSIENWPMQHDQIPPPVSVLFDDMTHPMLPVTPAVHVPHVYQMHPPPPGSTSFEPSHILDKSAPSLHASNDVEMNPDADAIEDEEGDSIKLPHAVEKLFALKTERAQQLGVDPDEVVQAHVENKENTVPKPLSRTFIPTEEFEEDVEEVTLPKTKESKNKHRKKKKKQKRAAKRSNKISENEMKSVETEPVVDIDIEYVQDVLDPSDPLYSQFIKIFEKFKLAEPEKENTDASLDAAKEDSKADQAKTDRRKPVLDEDDDDEDMDDEKKEDDDKPKLSKRKLKKLSRMSVAELKQKVNRPELVEMHDVTAKDPVLLLHLKASRNTVPVPRHWCFKRKYLQGKRGIEKPAFELPDFIKKTGIMEMRQALQEKEDQKTMKAKMRERVRPKLGKIDIDYQKLHDAFFKWQTKPKMTIHGDLYYEGKEFETRLKEKKPGDLSDDLRIALGMPTGPNANKCPPPWLIAMQRYGPPPSYPNLKIPGLNAPIPDGCSFGYHAGGWGKPPVDEMGRPLYGDVFGVQSADNLPHLPEEEIDHTLWGELESESSEEEEEEEEEDDEDDETKEEDDTGLVTPAEGLITPSGFSSIPAGMETPDMIELRKRKIEAEMEGGETPALYTILPEKKSEKVGAAMMGSTHIYDMAGAIPTAKVKPAGTTSVTPQGIEVALDPSELEMDTAAMAARYEQTMREQQSQLEKEDLSDMVAEHAARQKTKRKRQQQDSGKAPKKYKEFKF